MEPAAAPMKSAATAAVEASASTAVPASSMLSQRHLRHPRQRQNRHANQSSSNQNSLFHITTLGSHTTPYWMFPHPIKIPSRDSTPARALSKCSGRL
jgi:hypothetical protein